MPGEHSVRDAYERFAPIYDEFNASNNYEMWLGEVLLPELARHGLRRKSGKVLDVGCGTGRAFEPLLKRGWHITGCDASPAMLDRARENSTSPAVALFDCDARELPRFAAAPFDLILALNDVFNYLTDARDLASAFSGMKRNLSSHGLICFDTNTLEVYRESFANGRSDWMSAAGHEWRGLSSEAVAGAIHEAEISGPAIEAHVHRQRHWPRQQITAALEAAGLQSLTVLGQREDGAKILLEDPPNEELHYKAIWIAGNKA